MKVREIEITNILGIDSLTIRPGALTVIEGRNASGKTSVLEALKAVLSGGHDPSLIRNGADESEVLITLADGIELWKRITPERSTLTVRHPQFGKISKSQAWLDKIVDSISLDPVAFLTAAPRDRVNILLEAIPMQVSAEQLGFLPAAVLDGKNLDGHALEVLGAIGKELYDQRTGVNRAAREKRATAAQISGTLPPAAPIAEGGWAQKVEELRGTLSELQSGTRKRVEALREEARAAADAAKDACSKYVTEVNAELERRIAELRAEADRRKADVVAKRDAKITAANEHRDVLLAQEQAAYEPHLKELNEQLGQARAMLEQETRAAQTRQFVERLQTDATDLERQSEQLTEAMRQLDSVKASLLEKLPIADLEISGGDILVDGIQFDRVNESRRVRLAIEIARLRAGELSLIVVDNIERLDSASFEIFKAAALESGLQFIAAKVTDSQLQVVTE